MIHPLLYSRFPLRAIPTDERTQYYHQAACALEQSLHPTSSSPNSEHPLISHLISLINNQTKQGGTGLVLNQYGFVLTSYHLVDQFTTNHSSLFNHTIHDRFHQNHRIDPTFIACDKEHDLALLRALDLSSSLDPLPISPLPLTQNQPLHYLSYVDGKEINFHQGNIKEVSYDVKYPAKTISDALIFTGIGSRGFSGAPLFNNQNHLIGNLFGGTYLDEDDDTEYNLGTKAEYISSLLTQVIKHLRNRA